MASYTRDQIVEMTAGKDGSRYSRAYFTFKDFSGLNLTQINFNSALLVPNTDLTQANLDGATVKNACFAGIYDPVVQNRRYTSFIDAKLSKLNAFTRSYKKVETDFSTVEFLRAEVKDCDFKNFNFYGAYLKDSIIERCNFTNCNFTNAIFETFFTQGAARNNTIKNCVFDNCYFGDTLFYNNVEFDSCTFKNAKMTYTAVTVFQDLIFQNCDLTGFTLLPFNNSTGNITFEDCNLTGATIPDQSQVASQITVHYYGSSNPSKAFRYLAYFN